MRDPDIHGESAWRPFTALGLWRILPRRSGSGLTRIEEAREGWPRMRSTLWRTQ